MDIFQSDVDRKAQELASAAGGVITVEGFDRRRKMIREAIVAGVEMCGGRVVPDATRERDPRATDEPYAAGRDAAHAERSFEVTCPYPEGSLEAVRWRTGLADGRFEECARRSSE